VLATPTLMVLRRHQRHFALAMVLGPHTPPPHQHIAVFPPCHVFRVFGLNRPDGLAGQGGNDGGAAIDNHRHPISVSFLSIYLDHSRHR
jgi:hypothetical protein